MKIKEVKNLSNEEYHNGTVQKEYWSSSNVKPYIISPREAYYQKNKAKKKSSDAMDFGTKLHDFLASKHVKGIPFEYNVFEPPINPKTNEPYGKTTKAYSSALSGIVNPISADDYEVITDIWEMIQKSDSWYIIEDILRNGTPELSVFLEDEEEVELDEDGNIIPKYKVRYDAVTESEIYDWKTTTKAYWNERAMKSQIVKLGYDISAAMYQWAEHQRTGIWKDFYIVWILKEEPYDVLVSYISEFAYTPTNNGKECIKCSGAIAFEMLKEQHEACMAANSWKGLSAAYEGGIANFEPNFDRNITEFETE